MSVSGSINSGIRAVLTALQALVWCIGTLWLGLGGVWRAVWILVHVGQTFSKTLHCPRGHAFEAFGPLRCGRCGAIFEAHVFDPCPSCGASVRFIACPTCHLAVRNRLT